MPTLIARYEYARLLSVKKCSNLPNDQWEWRKDYIGFEGCLLIFQSEFKYPGKTYIHITDFHRYLTTGCGEYVIDGNRLTIITRNSKYIFEIQGKETSIWLSENY